jgi:hypothetical protein
MSPNETVVYINTCFQDIDPVSVYFTKCIDILSCYMTFFKGAASSGYWRRGDNHKRLMIIVLSAYLFSGRQM